MSGRFVRASKYRHVFGRSTKREQCYDNLRITKNAWDTNLVKANPSYISVNWEASGGGAFAVIPVEERGKLPEKLPLFRGHTAAVLDTDWSPFDDDLIASGSDDGRVMLWRVPEGFSVHQDPENIRDVAPVRKLAGHSRKVGHVLFNPSAQNVLASSSGDYTVKMWDLEDGSPKLTLKHNDIVQSLSWSANGSLLVTTCRDKKLRVWDVRQEKPALETTGHSGAKNSRAVWMGDKDRVATTGFSKMSDRQLGLWDIRAGREPIDGFQMLDQISGVCMPFWDDGCNCLYLAGKGDGNIRYYEYENDKFEYLSQHSSPDPQRGIAFLPKRGVNTHENEVMRAYRTVNDGLIEPVSFIVPRRAEVFQEDIYPPTVGTKPGLSSTDWFEGQEALPPKISLASVYEGHTPDEVPGDYKPPPPEVAKASIVQETAEEPKAEFVPTTSPVTRAPAKSIKGNQASIAEMASKFADKDEDGGSEEENTSSFEELAQQVEQPNTLAAVSNGISSTVPIAKDSPIFGSKPSPAQPIDNPGGSNSVPLSNTAEAHGIAHRSTSSTSSVTGTATDNLKSHLRDIKEMLERQQGTLDAHSEQLRVLTKEAQLRRIDAISGTSDSAKDERIRMLELELEQARQ